MSAETHPFLEPAWTANPFASPSAMRHSSYSGYSDGQLVRLLETRAATRFGNRANAAFRQFVLGPSFSCLAAKSAIRRGTYRVGAYARIDDGEVTEGLARDLFAFGRERRGFESDFTSFVAFFREGFTGDEEAFEVCLWSQLQRLHNLDAGFHRWDPRVSSDAADPEFSFSFAGHAFFVVGLHPNASRRSRRFAWPALVFNAHEQFEHLREIGAFNRLQQTIRQREIALDGSINANLAEYGTQSEARQYSGRTVPRDWQCPFRPRA